MAQEYVQVGEIIEQERAKRQAQISKGVDANIYDQIEKAHKNDFSELDTAGDKNLEKFTQDVGGLNKAETEFLLSKIQRQINADPESKILKLFRAIAANHLGEVNE